MAATRLQLVSEKLEEKCKSGEASKIDKLYGSFLMEARNLKAAIAKLAEQTLNVDSVDTYRSLNSSSEGVWGQGREHRIRHGQRQR